MICQMNPFKAVVLAAGAVALSGCAVLKTPDPIQTYRFGATPAFAATEANATCEKTSLTLRRIDFNEAARGDRLLSVTGTQTAYIGGGRWVSSAETQFLANLEDGFAQGAPCVQVSGGPFARDGKLLSVDVRRFETVYSAEGAVPEVKISVALVLSNREREMVASHRIEITEDAGSNRLGGIVAAYDRANAEAVRQIVTWTAQEAAKTR